MYMIFLYLWIFALIDLHSGEGVQMSESNECHVQLGGCNEKSCSYTCDDLPDVTYILEPSNGTVKAKFPHPPFNCCLNTYTILLMVNEEVKNETSCNVNLTKADTWSIHSKRFYLVKECENTLCNGSKCNEYGEVKFNNVFSGCYKLRIDVKRNGSTSKPLESCPQYITTNSIKSYIAGELNVNSMFFPKEKQLKFEIFPHFTFRSMSIELEIKDYFGRLHHHSGCILHNGGLESSPNLSVKKKWNGSCQHNSTKYICFTAEKLSPGNYSITVNIDDDRCEYNTLWTKSGHCKWIYNTFGTESDDVPVATLAGGATMWIFIIIIVVILIHVIFGIWCIIRNHRKPATPVQPEYVALRPTGNCVNVLLLYPRDCSEFMATMSSFRRLLERFNGVEVHDCFATLDDRDPLDWLRKIMNYPKLCIIVVTSHCAFTQQEAIQSGDPGNSNNIYRDPSYLDSVFLYGLKQMMIDFSPTVYQKIHIIGIKGFSDDNKMLTLPSSLRRYNIPEHLEKLLSEMNLEYNQGGRFHDTAEYLSLKINIKNLINYKLKNPEYLGRILNLK